MMKQATSLTALLTFSLAWGSQPCSAQVTGQLPAPPEKCYAMQLSGFTEILGPVGCLQKVAALAWSPSG